MRDLNIVVTGGCGFIGSYLVESLFNKNYYIVVIDNLSNGSINNLPVYVRNNITLVIDDLKKFDGDWLTKFDGMDCCFHFAANPEVRISSVEPRIHFNENIVTTFNILEACRVHDVQYLIFASSSTVYGDAKVIPTPEDYQPLEPISIYGASKLACENLIISYSKLYGIKSLILRYANIIGPRSNHGVIIDFINKLRRNQTRLEILGDGTQKKSYLYIDDAVDATIHLFNNFKGSSMKYDIYNVGNRDWITVKEIADIIVDEMNLKNVEYIFKPMTSDGRGWPGDVKFMLLDISKLESTGWSPKLNSYEAVRRLVKEMVNDGNGSFSS